MFYCIVCQLKPGIKDSIQKVSFCPCLSPRDIEPLTRLIRMCLAMTLKLALYLYPTPERQARRPSTQQIRRAPLFKELSVRAHSDHRTESPCISAFTFLFSLPSFSSLSRFLSFSSVFFFFVWSHCWSPAFCISFLYTPPASLHSSHFVLAPFPMCISRSSALRKLKLEIMEQGS